MIPAEADVMLRHSASQMQSTQHQSVAVDPWAVTCTGQVLGVCGPGKLPEAALMAAPYVPLMPVQEPLVCEGRSHKR